MENLILCIISYIVTVYVVLSDARVATQLKLMYKSNDNHARQHVDCSHVFDS